MRRRTAVRPFRRALRVARRRARRRILRRTRRFLFGTAIVLAIAGSANNYKLHQNDVSKIENYYGKPAEDLNEQELLEAMRKLGIKKLEITDNEENSVTDSIGEE
jgi:hypothetical protein